MLYTYVAVDLAHSIPALKIPVKFLDGHHDLGRVKNISIQQGQLMMFCRL